MRLKLFNLTLNLIIMIYPLLRRAWVSNRPCKGNSTRNFVYSSRLLLFQIFLFLFMFAGSRVSAPETIMGLTSNGGPEGKGTVFTLKTNNTGFTLVKSFPDWGKTPNGSLI